MKTKLYLTLVFFCLIIGSCKKQDPQTTATNPTPVFYFNGTVNAAPINIQAGNGPYMYSSYALDANGVYNFTGELKGYGCTSNCPNSLKIYLKDYRKYSVAPTTVDSSLLTGYRSFATPAGTASAFSVQFFDTLYNGTAASYQWDFGDGGTATTHKPVHFYNHPGTYNVSLTTQSNTSCSSSLSNSFNFGQVGNPVIAVFAGKALTATTDTFLISEGGGTPPYTHLWAFGDGATSTVYKPTHTYANAGVYAASFTVIDAVNNKQIYYANVATQNTSTCYNNFYPISTTPISNPMNLADVTIEWRDAGGNLYTSNNNNQPSTSMFNIISVDDYQNNTNGQPTKKIHAKVSCTVYSSTNSMVLQGDVVFAVAHL